MVLLLLGTACGGSESTDGDSPATTQPGSDDGAETPPPDEQSDPPDESPGEAPDVSAEVSFQARSVELPSGIQVSQRDNQTASLGGTAYIVTARPDGMRLIEVSADGAGETEAFIAGGTVAEVFNSGTRVVMTGSDGEGNLIVLSSTDGMTFAEATISVPQRYVDADVWQATSLLANVSDVADLGDQMYLVARVGISWPRVNSLVIDYAYTISKEAGDAAASAGTIRQTAPDDDGDRLVTFERNGEVVFEALTSEAGIEPGYSKAQAESRDTDTGFYGSWIIDGSIATQTATPPLDGGLETGLTLRDLYPVSEGVAALFTDFNLGVEAPEAHAPGAGILLGSSGGPSPEIALGSFSNWGHDVSHSWDGESWVRVGMPVGQQNGPPPDVHVDVATDTFGMSYIEDGLFVFLDSEDGLDWEVPEWTFDISLPAGNRVEVQRVNGQIIMVVHPAGDEGEFRAFSVVPDESGGDAYVEEIELDPAPPTIVWTDEEPEPTVKVEHPIVTLVLTILKNQPRGLAISIGGVLEGLLDD
jgi:hypothetical protein